MSCAPTTACPSSCSPPAEVRGLDWGADDYVTKPFSHRELVARIRAQLRRSGAGLPPQEEERDISAGPLHLDLAEHRATKDGERLDLTVTEFRLLHYLMRNAGSVVPSRDLLRHVWNYDDPRAVDVLRVTLHRLRRKLGDDGNPPRLIRTVPGVGVILSPEPVPSSPEGLAASL